jgi:hypothetical protein
MDTRRTKPSEVKGENKLSDNRTQSQRDFLKAQSYQSSEAKKADNPAQSRIEAPSRPVDQDSQVTLLQEKIQKDYKEIKKILVRYRNIL